MKGETYMRRRAGDLSQAVNDYFSSLDKWVLLTAIALSVFGYFAINTATAANALHSRYVTIHLIGIVAGLMIVFVFSKMDYVILGHFSIPIIVVCAAVFALYCLFRRNGGRQYGLVGYRVYQCTTLRICENRLCSHLFHSCGAGL